MPDYKSTVHKHSMLLWDRGGSRHGLQEHNGMRLSAIKGFVENGSYMPALRETRRQPRLSRHLAKGFPLVALNVPALAGLDPAFGATPHPLPRAPGEVEVLQCSDELIRSREGSLCTWGALRLHLLNVLLPRTARCTNAIALSGFCSAQTASRQAPPHEGRTLLGCKISGYKFRVTQ